MKIFAVSQLHFDNREVMFRNDTEGFAQNGITCYLNLYEIAHFCVAFKI